MQCNIAILNEPRRRTEESLHNCFLRLVFFSVDHYHGGATDWILLSELVTVCKTADMRIWLLNNNTFSLMAHLKATLLSPWVSRFFEYHNQYGCMSAMQCICVCGLVKSALNCTEFMTFILFFYRLK